jgi:hypothetical protein
MEQLGITVVQALYPGAKTGKRGTTDRVLTCELMGAGCRIRWLQSCRRASAARGG